MNKEIPFDQDRKALNIININNSTGMTKILMPLHITWKPKEDISTNCNNDA